MTNRIRELRESKGMTQADLAERADVARQTILAIEKGRYDPSLSLAFRIADILGMSIDDVFRPER